MRLSAHDNGYGTVFATRWAGGRGSGVGPRVLGADPPEDSALIVVGYWLSRKTKNNGFLDVLALITIAVGVSKRVAGSSPLVTGAAQHR